jgi:hypothetical protein
VTAAVIAFTGARDADADFYDKAFEARLLHTLDRQSPDVATLGRQASLAYLGRGSLNPAAASWRDSASLVLSLSAAYVDASSSAGSHTTAAPITARWYSPALGTAYFTYAHTHTGNGTGRGGLQQRVGSDEYIAGYGRVVTDAWAIGASVRITDASIEHEFSSAELEGRTLRATTRFVAPDLNLGLAGRLSDTLTLGISGAVSKPRPRTVVQNVQSLVIPSPVSAGLVVVPAGTEFDTFKERLRQYALGAGLGLHPRKGLGIYSDVRAVRLTRGRAGTVDLARVAVGFEHSVSDRWSWRGGISLNSEHDATGSLGVSYRLRTFDLQLAWQNNAAPEINPELGRTRLIAASISLGL